MNLISLKRPSTVQVRLCSASGIWNSAAQLPLNGAKQSSKPVNAFRVEFGGLGHTSSVGLIANLALERHI